MHANYFFILDDLEKDYSPDDIFNLFVEFYVNEYCDGNNWYQEEALVFWDGTVMSLCEEGDWRGRDKTVEYLLSLPQKKRIPTVLTASMKATAYDVGLFDATGISFLENEGDKKISQMGYEPLIDQLEKNFDELIIKILNERKDDSFRYYYVKKRASIAELFNNYSIIKPFTWYLTNPYNYRAFDLRKYNNRTPQIEEGQGILLVDIHT